MSRLGAVTIGQSPRTDIVPELRTVLGPEVEILEAGALDGLSAEAIRALAPEHGETVLVSRLRDGTPVRLAHDRLLPLLERQVAELAPTVDAVLLLCTGSFHPFSVGRPVLYPEHLLLAFARAVFPGHIGVITPDHAQIEEQQERWGKVARQVTVAACSPYAAASELPSVGVRLAEAGAECIVLDSLGYSLEMKQEVRRSAGRPVLLPRTILARAAAELL
ncbi:MAG: AroM family protein [Armatimonadota bacterium]|nr:AroM family protein [Armatimonadota bacterium]MDR7466200.1 AroM family protein [Armatimonadota bacterium]MDR7495117.1 AroM family protein [Armatimonadota bacterium]MDR7500536.1 AroM family protein [Armatimonadota bacterium]MDR7505875.1 AroM family protein [Armatimonadota bacterium]